MPAFFSLGLLCLLLLIGGAVYEDRAAHGHAPVPGAAHKEAAPGPVSRGLAPAGTFYMVRYASVRTPTGVYGFEPGHEVRLLQSDDDQQTMLVSDGQQSIEVERALLTDNLDVADAVRRADQAAQAAIFAERMRQRHDYALSHRDIFIAHARSAHDAEVLRVREAAIGGVFSSRLDLPAQPVGVHDAADDPGLPATRPARPVPSVMEPDDAALYSELSDLSTSPRTMLSGTR